MGRYAALVSDNLDSLDPVQQSFAGRPELYFIDQFEQFEQEGYGHFPVCMAKTQYSFSTDPGLMGAPSNHRVKVRELALAAGAESLVVVCGDIMRMPGLPRQPAANSIYVNELGQIEGLF